MMLQTSIVLIMPARKKALNDDFTAEHEAISDLKVELLTPAQITPNQEIKFEISYQVKQDIPTYIAFFFD